MLACTGLPPGLLMCSTTPTVPESSNASSSAELMSSALALLPAAISPSIDTSAVWRLLDSLPSPEKSNTASMIATTAISQRKRNAMRQRRARRCSMIAAIAMRSSAARSQPGSWPAPRAVPEESGEIGWSVMRGPVRVGKEKSATRQDADGRSSPSGSQ